MGFWGFSFKVIWIQFFPSVSPFLSWPQGHLISTAKAICFEASCLHLCWGEDPYGQRLLTRLPSARWGGLGTSWWRKRWLWRSFTRASRISWGPDTVPQSQDNEGLGSPHHETIWSDGHGGNTLLCCGVCWQRRDAPSTKGSWQHKRETGLRQFLPENVHQTVLQLDNPPWMLTWTSRWQTLASVTNSPLAISGMP